VQCDWSSRERAERPRHTDADLTVRLGGQAVRQQDG